MTSVVFEYAMWNCKLDKVVATYISTFLTLCIFSNIWFKLIWSFNCSSCQSLKDLFISLQNMQIVNDL